MRFLIGIGVLWLSLGLLPGRALGDEPVAPPVAGQVADSPPPPPIPTPPVAAAPATEIKVSLQLGINFVDGNSFLLGISGGAMLSLRRSSNGFELISRVAYGQVGKQAPGGPVTSTVTATFLWWIRAWYDRYFLEKNSVFIGLGSDGNFRSGILYRFDPIAGYARILWQSPRQNLRGELGYGYTYEHYVENVLPSDGQLHNARLGIRYRLTLNSQLALENRSEFHWALNQIERVRINSLTSFRINLWKVLALNMNLKIKVDTLPPFRPPLAPSNDPQPARYDPYDITFDVMLGFNWPLQK